MRKPPANGKRGKNKLRTPFTSFNVTDSVTPMKKRTAKPEDAAKLLERRRESDRKRARKYRRRQKAKLKLEGK